MTLYFSVFTLYGINQAARREGYTATPRPAVLQPMAIGTKRL